MISAAYLHCGIAQYEGVHPPCAFGSTGAYGIGQWSGDVLAVTGWSHTHGGGGSHCQRGAAPATASRPRPGAAARACRSDRVLCRCVLRAQSAGVRAPAVRCDLAGVIGGLHRLDLHARGERGHVIRLEVPEVRPIGHDDMVGVALPVPVIDDTRKVVSRNTAGLPSYAGIARLMADSRTMSRSFRAGRFVFVMSLLYGCARAGVR